jgi:hypothetical protein
VHATFTDIAKSHYVLLPEPFRHAFSGIRDAFPDADGTWAELAWSALHGLVTLRASGRRRASQALMLYFNSASACRQR